MTQTIDLLAFARAEERRQAVGTAAVADESQPIAGGIASFAGVGSWANQASGCGMEGLVEPAEVARLVDFYKTRGVQPQIEVCPFADESLIAELARLGFVTRGFENVLARSLEDALPSQAKEMQGVEVRPLDPGDEAMVQRFFDVAVTGFELPDRAAFEHTERRMIQSPLCRPMMAFVDGELAAVGNCDVTPPVAGFFGMTTLPPHRRRGCQQALILARLKAAQAAGCVFASIHSAPHVPTGRNALRLGFVVAYTKSIIVLPDPTLAASP